MSRFAPLALALAALTACAAEPAEAPASIDAVALMEQISASYTEGDYVRLNEEPVASVALAETYIDVWVSAEAADDYLTVSPGATGSRTELPVGTAIVREVRDAEWALVKRTILYRGDAPNELGGWIFGVVDAEGFVTYNDAGEPQAGLLADCASCHLSRTEDGHLFGLPR
ncbi:MAG: hypothetical protein H6741_17775 [Alphaproteobacteria bacterium]|nr:hypothetical protein [Alphaproteobacteria bacterium]MCB9794569.1 hypothetical protein [Alphaproteobacteria bacterium]